MKTISFVILSVLLLLACRAYAQHDDAALADSCLKTASNSYEADTVKKYASIAYTLSQRLNDDKRIYSSVNNLAWAYSELRMFDSAIVMYKKQLQLIDNDKEPGNLALVYCNLGLCYKNTSDYFDMWDCFRKAADIYTELKDTSYLCWATRSMGMPYAQLGLFNSAKNLYNEALRLSTMSGDTVESALTLYYLADCTLTQYIDSLSPSAADTLLVAKRQFLSVPSVLKGSQADYSSYTGCILNISKCYVKLANLLSRNDFADSSRVWLDIFMKNHYDADELWHRVETTLLKCEIDVFRGNYQQPVRELEQLLLQIPADTLTLQSAEACRMLSICYKATGNYKKAYDYTVKFDKIQENTHNEEAMKRLSNFAAQTRTQRIRNERQMVVESVEKEKSRQQSFYILIGVAFVVVVAVAVIVCMFLVRKRRFNALLKSASVKLDQLSNDLAAQRNAEEEAKGIMISSVEYASQIQTDTIGSPEKVKELFPDSFVYYQPRDIVSGDWYYADIVRGHKLLVGADCTGHGIPGAMLSILGVAALKDIINKLESNDAPILPGEILDNMRILVKKSLNKTTEIVSKADVDDGM
ncbi:MAG: tetratricopeptide repeat protein, partial [Bacteroidales bacterium]|nr:tetratricopeptide repeat protein [Bacteroidales bacterium]